MFVFVLTGMLSSVSPEGVALVIANNRSLELSRPDLHYADDDGAKWAALFEEMYGAENVVLLTEFDTASTLLYPERARSQVRPTHTALRGAVASLQKRIEVLGQGGVPIVGHVVIAAHGDIAEGQGFVELQDGRFSARDLEQEIVARLKVDRLHLVLDSCNSYFMLNPRKPGVRRWEAPRQLGVTLLEKYPHVGALISTSAEAVTYEWSELQSGIFSYELRSAFRGAADSNNDNQITYEEVRAFVTVANESIVNELYRPRVFSQGPSDAESTAVADWRSRSARQLLLGAEDAARLTLRAPNGVRILDVHQEPGIEMTLHLPRGPDAIDVHATRQADGRTTRQVLVLARGEPVWLSDLLPSPSQIATRGDSPVFDQLFRNPFGPRAQARLSKMTEEGPDPSTFGISQNDVERLEHHLSMSAELERDERHVDGLVNLGVGAILMTPGLVLGQTGGQRFTDCIDAVCFERRSGAGDDSNIRYAFIGPGAALLLYGIYDLAIASRTESLHDDYLQLPKSNAEERSAAVLNTERAWSTRVRAHRTWRHVWGGAYTFLGLSLAGLGAFSGIAGGNPAEITGAYMAGGLGFAAYGLYRAFWARTPIERNWSLYTLRRDNGVTPSPDQEDHSVQVTPARFENGWGLSLGGRF